MGLQLSTENSNINILLTSWGISIVFLSVLLPRPQYQQNPTKVLLNKETPGLPYTLDPWAYVACV